MAEWSKAHAWKVCIPQKGIAGSNPALSAGVQRSRKSLGTNTKLRRVYEEVTYVQFDVAPLVRGSARFDGANA